MKTGKNRKAGSPPLVTFVGKSGSGKTTLVVKLIKELTGRGFKVGSIKHDVHGFDMDLPGKDSHRHKQAGAVMSLISSPERIGIVRDTDHDHSLPELLEYFSDVDIVISEGFKKARVPKIEIFRNNVHEKPVCLGDENLIGFVTDSGLDPHVPGFDLEDTGAIADFLMDFFNLQ